MEGKYMIREYTKSDADNCPLLPVHRIISGKWNIFIIYFLERETLRFGELRRKLPNMTQATLSRQLKDLIEEGMIERKDYQQIPPKVEYSLTDIGRKFVLVLEALEQWVIEYEKYTGQQAIIKE